MLAPDPSRYMLGDLGDKIVTPRLLASDHDNEYMMIDDGRCKALPLQQFLDQLQRGCFIPPRLDQHIEHFAFTVDRPPCAGLRLRPPSHRDATDHAVPVARA